MSYRVGAIGDLHIWGRVPPALFPEFESLHTRADVLVITGDITNNGMILQAERAAELLARAKIPIVAVMGNHDRRALHRTRRYCAILERAGVTFLNGSTFTLELPATQAAFAYLLEGALELGASRRRVARRELAVLGGGATIVARAASEQGRMLILAADPIGEPVARRGPFVMNTEAELDQAFDDYRNGRIG